MDAKHCVLCHRESVVMADEGFINDERFCEGHLQKIKEVADEGYPLIEEYLGKTATFHELYGS